MKRLAFHRQDTVQGMECYVARGLDGCSYVITFDHREPIYGWRVSVSASPGVVQYINGNFGSLSESMKAASDHFSSARKALQ